jgi:hypothetical protein
MANLEFNNPFGFFGAKPNNADDPIINTSPVDELKKQQEEQRARAEKSMKLRNFADTLRMVNANQSGNTQQSMMFANRLAQRKADQEARQKEAQALMKKEQLERDREEFIKNNPEYAQMIRFDQLFDMDMPTGNDGTSLMRNVNALADRRKRYAEMTPEEQLSPQGILLAKEIQDFEGLGGVLKYNAETEYEKNRAAEAGKQGVSFGEGPLTKGEVSADEKFGTFYVNYIEKGRGAKNIANAERLEDAEFIMKYAAQNGIGISGVPAGIIANRPTLSAFFNPEGVMSQERVASVIQQSLKEILGGQFTEKEGIALIQRGYNPSLSPEENLERLLDLKAQVDQIIESEQTAVDYYENNNKSLRGFKGKRYTKEDFNRDLVKDYTMDVIDLSDQALKDAYMIANEDSLWIKTLEKEINRRADKKR